MQSNLTRRSILVGLGVAASVAIFDRSAEAAVGTATCSLSYVDATNTIMVSTGPIGRATHLSQMIGPNQWKPREVWYSDGTPHPISPVTVSSGTWRIIVADPGVANPDVTPNWSVFAMSAFLRSIPTRAGLVTGTYKPDSSNTGVPAGTALAVHLGDITVTVPGTVLDSLDIHGQVKIQTRDVTIRNCRIRGNSTVRTNTGLVDCNSPNAATVTVTDCLLVPDFPSVWWDGVIGHDYSALRCEVYNTVDGFGVYNSYNGNGPANVSIEGCYVHDLAYISPDPNHADNHTHNDGCQIQGNSNILIRGNNIMALAGVASTAVSPYSPAVTGQGIGVTPNVGPVTGLAVDKNWIDGGAQAITYVPGRYGTDSSVGTITNNRFGRDNPLINKSGTAERRAVVIDPTLVVTKITPTTDADSNGNVYDDTGVAVTIYRVPG